MHERTMPPRFGLSTKSDLSHDHGVNEQRRGRPRAIGTSDRVLEAAANLVGRHGYAGTSIDAIAKAAGVSKPTIYLRWSTKAELVTASIERRMAAEAPEFSGDVRTDLIAILRSLAQVVGGVDGMAVIGTALAEHSKHPALLDLWRQRAASVRRRQVQLVLKRGIESGDVRDGIDARAATDLLLGAYFSRALAGEKFTAGWEARAVDLLLDGLATD